MAFWCRGKARSFCHASGVGVRVAERGRDGRGRPCGPGAARGLGREALREFAVVQGAIDARGKLKGGRRRRGEEPTDLVTEHLCVSAAVRRDEPTLKSMSTADLFKRPGAQSVAEIFWRLAVPLMAILLTLMAIPLSYVNPRIGRSFNLMVAILVFATYYNWISFAQSNLGQGAIGLPVALVMTHGLMAAIVVVVFRRQLSVHSLLRSVRGPPSR